jgi:acetylornithine deacetylase/succinyl-diaminopimelate desuccinylase-like protein
VVCSDATGPVEVSTDEANAPRGTRLAPMRRLFVLLAAFASCAARPAPTAAQAAPPAPSGFQPFVDDTRATLDSLVAVDTSHGRETDALRPIADRLRAAGLPVEVVESAPGHGNLIARYKGSGAKRPLLLIAHVDVVPVEGQPWTVPPFQVTEKDGYLWGRGVNDDKGMAAVLVALAAEMARTKPALSRDVIFALTSGEETGGTSGALWLTENHKDLIDAELALNEGAGTRLDDDGNRVIEVGLGAAEKTFQSYRLVVHGKGGHSSVPPTDSDPVLTLSRALVKIGEYRFPARVIPAAREELAADAKLEKTPVSVAEARVAVLGQVSDDDERILATDRIVNAHLRTTCVTTQLQGSPQDNVLPTTAEATVNCRILPDETPAQTTATLQRIVGDPTVEITPIRDFGYGPYSPVEGDIAQAVKKAAGAIWPGVPVVSTMGTGATDSRHLRAAGIRSYGISVSPTTRPDATAGHVAHGPDERRLARWLPDGARFLRDLTYELAR